MKRISILWTKEYLILILVNVFSASSYQVGMKYTFIISCMMAFIGATLLLLFKPKQKLDLVNNVSKRKAKFALNNLIAKEVVLFSVVAGILAGGVLYYIYEKIEKNQNHIISI